jgi:hypothetical protein
MVTLHREAAWKIAVYGREHGQPHFHIEGPAFRCSVSLATMEIIIGSAPPTVFRAAVAWARMNHALLWTTWRELNS